MNYKGFEVNPIGNATLQILEDKLIVSNIGDSGLDGVRVNTEGLERVAVRLAPFANLINTGGVVKKTILVKDGLDRVFTNTEQFMFYYPPANKIFIGYNSGLIPDGAKFYGKLEGVEVFEFDIKEEIEPVETDMPFIWGLVVLVAVVCATVIAIVAMDSKVEATVDSTTTTTKDSEGNTKETTNVKTEIAADPAPFSVIVNNREYIIDEYGIKTDSTIESINPTIANMNVVKNVAIEVLASKIGSFTINSID